MEQVKLGWVALGAGTVLFAGVLAWRAMPVAAPGPVPVASVQRTPETATRDRPNDPEAWKALGLARFDAQDFAGAATALERATTLAPNRADLWSALGEARVMGSATDPMPPAALTAFRKAIAVDPRDPRSRYFLAVQRDLTGDHRGAIDDWLGLLRDTPPGAPWEQDLRRTIAQVGKINRIDVTTKLAAIAQPAPHPLTPGPDAAQISAAAALPPAQQDAMAHAMVAQLEAKLKADPANVDGWIMLMRSRMTLGEPTKASAALAAAVAANPSARARLEGDATTLGVPR